MKKTHLMSALSCLGLALAPTAVDAQMCKWEDESGCVHYAEKCPPGREGEIIEIIEAIPTDHGSADSEKKFVEDPNPDSKKAMEEAASRVIFEPVKTASQLRGCWERIFPPLQENPNPNKIEIYSFEEPNYQYFCFESSRKLYTFMTNRKPDGSPRELKKTATLLPSVERYSVPRQGIVLIKHLDTDSELLWVSSVAKVADDEEICGLRTGDVYMTLRNFKTGEDLYARHLRRID